MGRARSGTPVAGAIGRARIALSKKRKKREKKKHDRRKRMARSIGAEELIYANGRYNQ